ncbi:MAG: hypothetical protein SFY70_10580 [Bacteroidia bacterium]|nr:hypothetical protein [Bacteroidia bacterium]
MAGGKLTPRQKMINMMYLVLTALLALNVSAEILESFNLIANSLKESANQFNTKNHNLGDQIKSAVAEEIKKNNTSHKDIPPKVEEITQKTDSIIHYLDTLIAALYSEGIGGKDEKTLKLKKPDETERNYRFWMYPEKGKEGNDQSNGGRGAGKAKELRDVLNGYVKYCNNFWLSVNQKKDSASGANVLPLPNGGKGFTEIARDFTATGQAAKNEKDNIWEYKIFHNTPVAANVAMLQKFKNDVNIIEAEILDMLRLKLQDVPFKIDSLILADAPESRVVPAGGQFVSEVFITTSSSQAQPQWGPGIRPNPGGQTGKFVVNASLPEGEKSYTISAAVPSSSGLKRLSLTKRYRVVKPQLDIDAEGGTVLWEQCCNDYTMKVIVPGSSTEFKPEPTLTPGTVTPNPQKPNYFTLTPGNARNAKLTVFTNVGGTRVAVGEKMFSIQAPPEPDIVFFVNGAVWDGKSDIAKTANLEVGVTANADFRRNNARDANYQLAGVALSAKVGLAPPTNVGGEVNSPVGGAVKVRVPLNPQLPSGTQITITIKEVVRVNCKQQRIRVTGLPPTALTQSARLK